LSFDYKKRSSGELEQMAEVVLSRYTHRCNGCFVDVEGIMEDCGLTLLLRRGGLNNFCEGYVAENPHYIILPEAYASYQPRYRPILGEELCHIILEYDILASGGTLPSDAKPNSLTPQQHKDIEGDAHYLSLAILLPKAMFIKKFNAHLENAPAEIKTLRDKHLIHCAEKLEFDFDVWRLKAAYRARDLNLITDEECRKFFSDRIPM
jgi:Zn-dependent peptidase ImmA (M78 family)